MMPVAFNFFISVLQTEARRLLFSMDVSLFSIAEVASKSALSFPSIPACPFTLMNFKSLNFVKHLFNRFYDLLIFSGFPSLNKDAICIAAVCEDPDRKIRIFYGTQTCPDGFELCHVIGGRADGF